jgi:hypothetical protein
MLTMSRRVGAVILVAATPGAIERSPWTTIR